MHGAVAAGHEKTAEAASLILETGGNAFDATLAALCAACVVEPVLTSLGGGGFLLARPASGSVRAFDFFVQTPRRKRPEKELDFYPILADFGPAQQEFHIGIGTVATPGTVRGLFDVHTELGSLPIRHIVEPAIGYAREGIEVNALQGYIFSIVEPIYVATDGARSVYASLEDPRRLPREGERLRQPALADTLENLAREGFELFYEGEIGGRLVELCASHGGHLQREDLTAYRSVERPPLQHAYRNATFYTNPPPSSGGLLIAFAQELLAAHSLADLGFGSPGHLGLLYRVMEQTNLARSDHRLDKGLLDPALSAKYRAAVASHPLRTRGTTQISVIDAAGNAASLTLSNGEGCGQLLPGTGIMLNNMLGEEDLNPEGFHLWPEDHRVSSMMAPSLAQDRRRLIVTGSGGSNRLRTAILQTLCNLIDFGMSAEDAVHAPRIHYERGLINIEPGFPDETIDALAASGHDRKIWDTLNLFFGGAHTVVLDDYGLSGAGDPRRGGTFRLV